MKQIVRRYPIDWTISLHQLTGDATHPWIVVNADRAACVISLPAPRLSQTDHVEAIELLIFHVVVQITEDANFAAPAVCRSCSTGTYCGAHRDVDRDIGRVLKQLF